MTQKPIIGITLDSDVGGSYSRYPWYAIRYNYVDSIIAAGGIPLLLPYAYDLLDEYANRIDGLMIPGGFFDICPSHYGEEIAHDTVKTNSQRTEFEFAITRKINDQKKPILGICGGMQLMNVIFGGSLIQHIPAEVDNALPHEQPNPRHEAGHDVEIIPSTRLHQIADSKIQVPVNSAHHQAIRKVAPGFIVNALASDGIIEGIELSAQDQFAIGLQWHPEFHISDVDRSIFNHFIQAAKN